MLLAGDVGGTKILFGLYDERRGVHDPVVLRSLESARFASLEDAVAAFLSEVGTRCVCASFGVAGPVMEGRATLTNLSWTVDASAMAARFSMRSVTLLNDLVATASALPVLEPEDLFTLQQGTPDVHGTRAIIAPGTGLGQAFVSWDGDHYVPHPSEGGHGDFAPRGDHEHGLLRYLEARFNHVSYERVCSGRGIQNIYAYLRDERLAPESAQLGAAITAAADPTPLIVAAALEQGPPDELSLATLRLFASVLAGEAGNLALTVLATGGVYLGGGLPPRLLSLLRAPVFVESFRWKGRMSEILERIPLYVILRPDAALLGAAVQGLEEMRRR
jgi:glucokinase